MLCGACNPEFLPDARCAQFNRTGSVAQTSPLQRLRKKQASIAWGDAVSDNGATAPLGESADEQPVREHSAERRPKVIKI